MCLFFIYLPGLFWLILFQSYPKQYMLNLILILGNIKSANTSPMYKANASVLHLLSF